MPIRLTSRSADFTARFNAFLDMKREVAADIDAAARAIVDDVAKHGDAALIAATRKFDRLDVPASGLRIAPAEIDTAVKSCDAATLDALKFARDRIETFHRRQLPKDERFTDAAGVELGWRWSAIEAVGLYVPGGTAAYPSSVLMNAVPAKVAGTWNLGKQELKLIQTFQVVSGTLSVDGKPVPIKEGKLRGNDLVFTVGSTKYEGRVNGDAIAGNGGAWKAARVPQK